MYNRNSGASSGSGHFGGNGLESGNGNGTGAPQTSYGIRSFQSSLDAHAFINTALNSGAGFVGTVAGGMEFQLSQGSRNSHMSNTFGPAFNGSNNNSSLSIQRYLGGGSGMTGVVERRLQVHPLSSRVFQQRPTPASGLVIFAEVQSQPGTGGTSSSSAYPGSPAASIISVGSGGSLGSHGCSCGCVCNLYCEEHAHRRCPVHGLGLPSSDEGSPCSPFSPISPSPSLHGEQ